MNTVQIPAQNIKPGMQIIPAGRKHALEVLSADDWNTPGVYQFGCYGKGFTVHAANADENVTVVL